MYSIDHLKQLQREKEAIERNIETLKEYRIAIVLLIAELKAVPDRQESRVIGHRMAIPAPEGESIGPGSIPGPPVAIEEEEYSNGYVTGKR